MPAAALRSAGFDLTTVSPETLALNRGSRSCFRWSGKAKTRRCASTAGAGSDRVHRPERLLAGPGRGRGDRAGGDRRADGSPIRRCCGRQRRRRVVTSTVRAEEQRHYDGMAAAAEDHWLWQSIFAPAEIQVSLQAPTRRKVKLHSGSAWSPIPPRPSNLTTTSSSRSTAPRLPTRSGIAGPHVITATVPSGVVRPGENAVTLKAPGDTGAPADSAMLDWIELTYPRELVLDEGELTFAGQAEAYDLATPGELAALWDITDPAAPVALSDYEHQGGRVRFASDGAPRRFVAAMPAGLRQPAAIAPVQGGDLRALPGGGPDHCDRATFRVALQPLVAGQKQGLRVAVVDVNQIYDRSTTASRGRRRSGRLYSTRCALARPRAAFCCWPAMPARSARLLGATRRIWSRRSWCVPRSPAGRHRMCGTPCRTTPRGRAPPWQSAASPRRPPSSSPRWWPRLWTTRAVIGRRPGAMMLCWWPTTMSRGLRRRQRRSASG